MTSILGGLIVGIAAFPREPGSTIAWSWVLLLSPLWGILFGVFGIAPVVTRTADWLPLTRNFLGFIGSSVAAYLLAQYLMGRNSQAGDNA